MVSKWWRRRRRRWWWWRRGGGWWWWCSWLMTDDCMMIDGWWWWWWRWWRWWWWWWCWWCFRDVNQSFCRFILCSDVWVFSDHSGAESGMQSKNSQWFIWARLLSVCVRAVSQGGAFLSNSEMFIPQTWKNISSPLRCVADQPMFGWLLHSVFLTIPIPSWDYDSGWRMYYFLTVPSSFKHCFQATVRPCVCGSPCCFHGAVGQRWILNGAWEVCISIGWVHFKGRS